MKPLFHEVELEGSGAAGRLFLHSMPGRFEPIAEFVIAAGTEDVYCILCLAPDAEIAQKSPGYLEALGNETLRKRVVRMPIEDFGTPGDTGEFSRVMDILVAALDAGRNVLIHCAAGVGRTGTVAICLLSDLGLGLDEASGRIREAGSEPETGEQREFIRRYGRDAGRE